MTVHVKFNALFAIGMTIIQFIWAFFYTFIEYIFPKRRDISPDTVLVTNAASEVGRLVSREFVKEGCAVILWDSDEDGMNRLAQELKEIGGRVHTYKVDMADGKSISSASSAVQKDVGTVSILVNNISGHTGKRFLEASNDDIEWVLRVATYGPLVMVKSFLPSMLQQNKGHIVTIANTTSLLGHPDQPHYSAVMKAAVGMNESLRLEFQKLGMKGLNTTIAFPYYASKSLEGTYKGVFSQWIPFAHKMDLAVAIVDAVKRNHPFVIRPFVMRAVPYLKTFLPIRSFEIAMDLLGLTEVRG